MEILVSENRQTEFRGVPPFLFDLLKDIAPAGASTDPRAESRLFPPPVRHGDDAGILEDWNAFVQPGLQQEFQAARDVVQADVRRASHDGSTWALEIPFQHAEAWLNALNQARLAIAEEHGFGDGELMADLPSVIEGPRDRALFQMHFYGMIQEWFVKFLD